MRHAVPFAFLLAAGALGAQAPAPAPGDSLGARREQIQHLVDRRQWKEALAALSALRLDAAGRNLAARLAVNAGVTALAGGDSAGAAAYWIRSLTEDPSVGAAPADLGALLLAEGRRDSALHVAERGLAANPGDERLQAVRHAALAAAYRRRAASDDSAFARIGTALADSDWRRADSGYGQLLARAPANVTALEGDAGVALRLGDTARAVALYARDLAVDSGGLEGPLGLLHLTHPAADRARDLLLGAEWRGIAALEGVELAGATAARGSASPEVTRPLEERRRQIEGRLRWVLDTVIFETPWGPDELTQLERTYPASPLIARYAARLAVRTGRDSLALARYDALLARTPDDAGLQGERAQVLERLGRVSEATAGWTRALDLVPEDSAAYRALIRLDEPRGALGSLLEQLQRLRIRVPRSRVVADHEIEVLQRLGRVTEAEAAARRLAGRPS